MLTRRLLLAALPASVAVTGAQAAPDSFAAFLASLRQQARHAGIAAATLDHALTGLTPNQAVLKREQHQPEFTMTWARYRNLLVTGKRIDEGVAAYRQSRTVFAAVRQRYAVDPGIIAGIWGLESSYGTKMGDFRVVDALATLAWATSRRRFFSSELLAALKILQHGDTTAARMTGSYAGAMGQPQFMPTSYLRYAVDFTGSGRRDIWTSVPDVLASIGNYLAQSGWRGGQSWGQPVALPAGFHGQSGRDHHRPLSAWAAMGLRPMARRWKAMGNAPAALLLPDGPQGDAFLVYANFAAIRRYNPSDFYALAVGLLGDAIVA
ncbi:MAG TPA: lytic murein transglycosylase [Acetobacteraceae bacterium]|nr:lytic murein transglycosylase [Acetobacteraceae bacterium]